MWFGIHDGEMVFPRPRELNKLSCFLVFHMETTPTLLTMGTNVCPACSKNEKKTASNTSQSLLLSPASPARNIISFRAKVESQTAYFKRTWAHFRKASVCIIFRGAASHLYSPCASERLTGILSRCRCLQEIGCYSIHTSTLWRCIFHEICKWGQQVRDILDDRLYNGFWGMACFSLKSQFNLFFFECSLITVWSGYFGTKLPPPRHAVTKRYLLLYKPMSRNASLLTWKG